MHTRTNIVDTIVYIGSSFKACAAASLLKNHFSFVMSASLNEGVYSVLVKQSKWTQSRSSPSLFCMKINILYIKLYFINIYFIKKSCFQHSVWFYMIRVTSHVVCLIGILLLWCNYCNPFEVYHCLLTTIRLRVLIICPTCCPSKQTIVYIWCCTRNNCCIRVHALH